MIKKFFSELKSFTTEGKILLLTMVVLPFLFLLFLVGSVVFTSKQRQQKEQVEQALQVYCREACFPNDLERVYGSQCYCKADILIRPIKQQQ